MTGDEMTPGAVDDRSAGESTGPVPHGLRWGLKSSFIDYVRRMPDGRGSVGEGAVPVGEGDLFYAYDRETSLVGDGDTRVWSFRGDVRFTGHMGMLFVRVAHPRLEVHGDQAVLTIEDPQGRADAPRLPLVRARLRRLDVLAESQTEIWGAEEVTLTAEGVEIFNEVYAEGEPFDPLVVQVPVG